MDTPTGIKAGSKLQFGFTLKEAYDKYLTEAKQAARRAGLQAIEEGDLKKEDLELAITAALKAIAINHEEEFFAKYHDEFVVHRPNVGEYIKIDNQASLLTRGVPESDQKVRGASLANMSATLMTVVDRGPEWYTDPLELENPDVIFLVHFAWRDFVDSFRI